MLTNPVVRKAIHEVRRHIIAHLQKHKCKPDRIVVELAREAKMSAKDSDKALFRNRLRNRIKNDIIEEFKLGDLKQNQQRASVERVVLAVQQGSICPLCGNQRVKTAITPLMGAKGEDCELAHIIPRGIGGPNGLNNMVLAHTKCNRDMGRRTPRDLWGENFETEMNRVERMYADVERVDRKHVDKASEAKLWGCYFDKRDDDSKVANFKKELRDIQGFSERDLTDTRYATRQVLAYLSDALFDGKGLPERGGERLIFTTDGRWTGDLRREWGLFNDSHKSKSKGLSESEERARREKKRGDHRHHALDAIVIALTSRQMQLKWDQRLKTADARGITAEQYDEFCRQNRINPPAPFKSADELQEKALHAVYEQPGGNQERPVSHRAVKRKIVGALHEETLFGPIAKSNGLYKGSKSVLMLTPNHLRQARRETEKEAIERLARRRQLMAEVSEKDARKWATSTVKSKGYKPKIVDPPPDKSGLVRDRALRDRLRVPARGQS
ncbi:MAG: HNH endonuclease [Planctomycetes bacterium]|nr:HNH endonuclease [Planctomycetota bacterium]